MLKSSGFVFIAKLFTAAVNFAIIVVISRWLGPVEKGVCSWYLVVIAVSLVFSEMIAGPAAGFLLKQYSERQVREISYVWAIICSVIVTTVFFLLGKITGIELLILMLLCWLNACNSIHLHLLLALQQFTWFNRLAIILPLLIIISLMIFFLSGYASRISYLCSLAIAWSIVFVAGILLLKNQPEPQPTKASWQALIHEGFRNGITNQAGHLVSLINMRMIFFILPATSLGVFSNALSLAEASMMIPGSLGQVMYAMILNQRSGQNAGKTLRTNWWLSMVLLLLVFIAVLIIPGGFYQFIFGAAFSGVKPMLAYLCGTMIFYGGFLILSYWQSAHGWFANNLIASIAAFIVNGTISAIFFYNGSYSLNKGIAALGAGLVVLFAVSLLQFRNKNRGLSSLLKWGTEAPAILPVAH